MTGVDTHRAGQRVWVYGAQSYRAFGMAAQYTVVPDQQAVRLPEHLGDEIGASLGIPGITAHRAVFADGAHVDPAVVSHAVALDTDDPAAAIRSVAPDGVHRVVEVSLSANVDLDNAVSASGTATRWRTSPRPTTGSIRAGAAGRWSPCPADGRSVPVLRLPLPQHDGAGAVGVGVLEAAA